MKVLNFRLAAFPRVFGERDTGETKSHRLIVSPLLRRDAASDNCTSLAILPKGVLSLCTELHRVFKRVCQANVRSLALCAHSSTRRRRSRRGCVRTFIQLCRIIDPPRNRWKDNAPSQPSKPSRRSFVAIAWIIENREKEMTRENER